MHTCNNKKCVNPVHLKLGSQSDNVKQSYKDGLQVNPHRLITQEMANEIRGSVGTYKALSEKFGTTYSVVKNIKQGNTYHDLTGGGTCGS